MLMRPEVVSVRDGSLISPQSYQKQVNSKATETNLPNHDVTIRRRNRAISCIDCSWLDNACANL